MSFSAGQYATLATRHAPYEQCTATYGALAALPTWSPNTFAGSEALGWSTTRMPRGGHTLSSCFPLGSSCALGERTNGRVPTVSLRLVYLSAIYPRRFCDVVCEVLYSSQPPRQTPPVPVCSPRGQPCLVTCIECMMLRCCC